MRARGTSASFRRRAAAHEPEVHLVDRDRRVEPLTRAARLHPLRVVPLVGQGRRRPSRCAAAARPGTRTGRPSRPGTRCAHRSRTCRPSPATQPGNATGPDAGAARPARARRRRAVQPLPAPSTDTRSRVGRPHREAHAARVRRCAPRRSYRRKWRPSLNRWRSSEVSTVIGRCSCGRSRGRARSAGRPGDPCRTRRSRTRPGAGSSRLARCAGTVLRFGLQPEVFERRRARGARSERPSTRTSAPSTAAGCGVAVARGPGPRDAATLSSSVAARPGSSRLPPRRERRQVVGAGARELLRRAVPAPRPARGVSNCTTHIPSAPWSRSARARRPGRCRGLRRRSPHRGAPRPGTPPPTALRRRSARTRLRSRAAPSGTNHKPVQPHDVVEAQHAGEPQVRVETGGGGARARSGAPRGIERREPPVLPARVERVGRRADRTRRARRASGSARDVEAVAVGRRSGSPGTAPDRARRDDPLRSSSCCSHCHCTNS